VGGIGNTQNSIKTLWVVWEKHKKFNKNPVGGIGKTHKIQ